MIPVAKDTRHTYPIKRTSHFALHKVSRSRANDSTLLRSTTPRTSRMSYRSFFGMFCLRNTSQSPPPPPSAKRKRTGEASVKEPLRPPFPPRPHKNRFLKESLRGTVCPARTPREVSGSGVQRERESKTRPCKPTKGKSSVKFWRENGWRREGSTRM